jgi:hypothetical protein
MFRNESIAVIVKAKNREKAKAKARTISPPNTVVCQSNPILGSSNVLVPKQEISDSVRFRLDKTNHGIYVKTHIPSVCIFPTIEERSLGYFSAHSNSWLRNFDLVDAICSESSTDEHLLASMSAVGLASFSNLVHAPELMIRARRDYVTAIQLTNAALRSPRDVKKDSTLFAVMILSIFETVTGNNEKSLTAWTEHINGAAALVKLRGQEQFNTQAGKRMFLQVTSNLMLSCIQRSLPMPAHIVELRKFAEEFMDSGNTAWRLSGIIIDLTIFRAAIHDGGLTGPREIIEEALKLDRRFKVEFENLPPCWRYQIVHTDETPELIWGGSYHVYEEFWVAHIWNSMRTCRILIQELIRDQLLSAAYSHEVIFTTKECLEQNEASEAIMIRMRDDILGSVPHHTQSNVLSTKGNNSGSNILLEGSRSNFILWPLYLAGAMDLTTDEIREWVIRRLRDIGDAVGLRQALVIAEYLADRKHISAWDRVGRDHQHLVRPPRPKELATFFTTLARDSEPSKADFNID